MDALRPQKRGGGKCPVNIGFLGGAPPGYAYGERSPWAAVLEKDFLKKIAIILDPEIDRVGLNDRSTAVFDRLDRSTPLSPTLSTQLDSGQR